MANGLTDGWIDGPTLLCGDAGTPLNSEIISLFCLRERESTRARERETNREREREKEKDGHMDWQTDEWTDPQTDGLMGRCSYIYIYTKLQKGDGGRRMARAVVLKTFSFKHKGFFICWKVIFVAGCRLPRVSSFNLEYTLQIGFRWEQMSTNR